MWHANGGINCGTPSPIVSCHPHCGITLRVHTQVDTHSSRVPSGSPVVWAHRSISVGRARVVVSWSSLRTTRVPTIANITNTMPLRPLRSRGPTASHFRCYERTSAHRWVLVQVGLTLQLSLKRTTLLFVMAGKLPPDTSNDPHRAGPTLMSPEGPTLEQQDQRPTYFLSCKYPWVRRPLAGTGLPTTPSCDEAPARMRRLSLLPSHHPTELRPS